MTDPKGGSDNRGTQGGAAEVVGAGVEESGNQSTKGSGQEKDGCDGHD